MYEYEWAPRAGCLGQPQLFELSDWPEVEQSDERHPDFVDWVNMERRKFQKAENICLDCPVFVLCGKTATAEDKKWTMRAGQWPTILVKAEAAPAHTCTAESHLPRRGGRLVPYCGRCITVQNETRDRRKRRTTAAAVIE